MHRWTTRIASLALLALAAAGAAAQDRQTIYRCTDAHGALTIQNGTPCPKGSRQKIEVVESPMVIPRYQSPPPIVTETTPPPPAPPASPGPERPQAPPPARIADADRLPPPPIYECHTWDNDSYISEDPEPKPRCAPLETTGLGGDGGGAGQACEMKYDLCARVPDEAACDGWRRRQREIESTWRYARAADRQPLQDAFARVAKILDETTCGKH